MATFTSVLNAGAPIKTSLPLAERKLGVGLGLSNQSVTKTVGDESIRVDLSAGLKSRQAKANERSDASGKSARSSPLTQALDALSDIADRIASLQEKFANAAPGSGNANGISDELNNLAEEFTRITSSSAFHPDQSESGSGGLGYSDRLVNETYNSGNKDRISALEKGLEGLTGFSFENIKTDRSIQGRIKDFIKGIKGALVPREEKEQTLTSLATQKDSVLVPVPQASIRTLGQAQGLGVSLLGYSNEDLIRAAAAHVNIDSTNVLILTYNQSESEAERLEREKKEKEQKFEAENPSLSATAEQQQAELES